MHIRASLKAPTPSSLRVNFTSAMVTKITPLDARYPCDQSWKIRRDLGLLTRSSLCSGCLAACAQVWSMMVAQDDGQLGAPHALRRKQWSGQVCMDLFQSCWDFGIGDEGVAFSSRAWNIRRAAMPGQQQFRRDRESLLTLRSLVPDFRVLADRRRVYCIVQVRAGAGTQPHSPGTQ